MMNGSMNGWREKGRKGWKGGVDGRMEDNQMPPWEDGKQLNERW